MRRRGVPSDADQTERCQATTRFQGLLLTLTYICLLFTDNSFCMVGHLWGVMDGVCHFTIPSRPHAICRCLFHQFYSGQLKGECTNVDATHVVCTKYHRHRQRGPFIIKPPPLPPAPLFPVAVIDSGENARAIVKMLWTQRLFSSFYSATRQQTHPTHSILRKS